MPVQQIPDEHANTVTIEARDLHQNDVMHRPNWNEHITTVDVETGGGVVFVSAEYPGIFQHLAADAKVTVER